MFAHVKSLCSTFSAEGSEVNSFSTREKRGKTVPVFGMLLKLHACMYQRQGEGREGEG